MRMLAVAGAKSFAAIDREALMASKLAISMQLVVNELADIIAAHACKRWHPEVRSHRERRNNLALPRGHRGLFAIAPHRRASIWPGIEKKQNMILA